MTIEDRGIRVEGPFRTGIKCDESDFGELIERPCIVPMPRLSAPKRNLIGKQSTQIPGYVLCNFFGIQTNLANLPIGRYIKSAKIESVFTKVFLFIHFHL